MRVSEDIKPPSRRKSFASKRQAKKKKAQKAEEKKTRVKARAARVTFQVPVVTGQEGQN